eukprot:6792-Heterococcus_DN1.PRE.2
MAVADCVVPTARNSALKRAVQVLYHHASGSSSLPAHVGPLNCSALSPLRSPIVTCVCIVQYVCVYLIVERVSSDSAYSPCCQYLTQPSAH